MPPKKKIIGKRKYGSRLSPILAGSSFLSDDDDTDNESTSSIFGNLSSSRSKVANLVKRTRNNNTLDTFSAQSSIAELENDDGFMFKRSGKPLHNKTNLLDQINEDDSMIKSGNKKSSTTRSARGKAKQSTPVRSSGRVHKPSQKLKNQSFSKLNRSKNHSKLLDLTSESENDSGIEDTLTSFTEVSKEVISKVKDSKPKNLSQKSLKSQKSSPIKSNGKSDKPFKITKPSNSRNRSTTKLTQPKLIQSKQESSSPKLTSVPILIPDTSSPIIEPGSPGIKEPLNISESPINRRNKEMRQNSNRRSSLGNRGKRTSSIGNGFEVSPHDDVLPTNFYKHLDQDLPEPHRMRQLLSWCFKRQSIIDNRRKKSSKSKQTEEDMIASNIAKVIKDELISDLVNGKIQTSWWNKDNDEINTKKRVKLVPNQRNVENVKMLKVYTSRVKKLKKELDDWDKIQEKYSNNLKPLEFDGTDSLELMQSRLKKLPKTKRTALDNYIKELESLNDEKLEKLNDDLQGITTRLEGKHEQYVENFNDFVDKLTFNDGILKNFEHNRKKEIAEIIKKNMISQDDDENDDDKSNMEVDDIEILRGITKIK